MRSIGREQVNFSVSRVTLASRSSGMRLLLSMNLEYGRPSSFLGEEAEKNKDPPNKHVKKNIGPSNKPHSKNVFQHHPRRTLAGSKDSLQRNAVAVWPRGVLKKIVLAERAPERRRSHAEVPVFRRKSARHIERKGP